MILPHLTYLASICANKGVTEAILSPGSRCAPVSLAFIRHPDIHCRIIPDERSAAFIAMGMAQQKNKPVVLICTSGSAALNYGPAIAEAYYQQIPLLVLTADRPAEWIEQWDGQTIRQENIYGHHIKNSYIFPDEVSHPDKLWHAKRIIKEALIQSEDFPMGPVHINIPLREPFYPQANEQYPFDLTDLEPDLDLHLPTSTFREESVVQLKTEIKKYQKVLIIPGQQRPDSNIKHMLKSIAENHQAVVITDAISNMSQEATIKHHDLLLINQTEKMVPELIISFGKSIVSKALKLFLRQQKIAHWHIQQNGQVPDTYQNLNQIIRLKPKTFLDFFRKEANKLETNFENEWLKKNATVKTKLPSLLEHAPFGELNALEKILKALPAYAKLHIANSMAVRNVNFLGLGGDDLEIICNRGTSGIDGSNSTAVGCTFTTKEPVVLVTGDMAFFYDRNAFWHQYNLPNLRIILFNNQGGGIFRMIDGPSKLPELDEYFETKQKLNGKFLAEEFNFHYRGVTGMGDLLSELQTFFDKSLNPKLLEIKCDSETNTNTLKMIKETLKV
ncbi:2-succinyl-5-enolpyruvyl-6-hydroxy-3-cyclohexene-1-carboxylic-acid synthase [Cyclobacterium marinum]|uniref:2-succinyl-5-enolpyruvyl-6-hydroxy-3- cyclohexene-1-carboxylic-acid synthase n=1 Tax=Cyclobacterium marinum TaxID=104 RepID=UPI0011EEF575|nr:2-succinyl-5-enolpyruvyl-6-hydroxy-3-cyclohexene-1-carboxylic-acid synthase [Cyclobacterium marinum]MBI0400220.1 2-succinyl-5-enolpyruvyl-6-hydroxy-3-cyclohexene-1-carboxylic-acid synthase [Cyclobacterium marinum]